MSAKKKLVFFILAWGISMFLAAISHTPGPVADPVPPTMTGLIATPAEN